jgi:hypothetical protein
MKRDGVSLTAVVEVVVMITQVISENALHLWALCLSSRCGWYVVITEEFHFCYQVLMLLVLSVVGRRDSVYIRGTPRW